MLRRWSCASLLLLMLLAGVAAAGKASPDCFSLPDTASKVDCLLATDESLERRAAALGALVREDPELLLAVLDRLEERPDSGPRDARPAADSDQDERRATWLDLRSRALASLGREADAARAAVAAFQRSSGERRLTWLDGNGGVRSTSLDIGTERIARAVEALRSLDRIDEARALAAQALRLGVEGWAADSWSSLGGGAVPGLDAEPSALLAWLWRERIPDIEIPLLGGTSFSLGAARGQVLLVDFWATWCAPCIEELPHIEKLYLEHRAQGLQVVAVNYRESPDTAMAFAQSLGFSLPIGIATAELEKFFAIESMPTVILADRSGRVRARWSGYEQGVEQDLTEAVVSLLAESEEPGTRLGDVLLGAGKLEVDWMRQARRTLEGVAVYRDGEGAVAAATTMSRSLDLFEGDGRELDHLKAPADPGRLSVGNGDDDAEDELFSYRRGGRNVVLFDRGRNIFETWEAPAPVFDLAVVPGTVAGGPGRLALATLGGLYVSAPDGGGLQRIEGIESASDVAPTGDGLIALEPGVRWVRLDAALEIVAERSTPADSWRLIPGAGATPAGVAGYSVVAASRGRFFDDGRDKVALALDSGQLVILDAENGAVEFRASWAGIRDLAGGRFDGGACDGLLVTDERRVSMLRSPSCRDASSD